MITSIPLHPVKLINYTPIKEIIEGKEGDWKIEDKAWNDRLENLIGEKNKSEIRRRLRIEKARSMLGFEPGVDLEQGLAKTIAWARANYASANSRHSSG